MQQLADDVWKNTHQEARFVWIAQSQKIAPLQVFQHPRNLYLSAATVLSRSLGMAFGSIVWY